MKNNTFEDLTVDGFTSPCSHTAKSTDSLSTVFQLMQEKQIRHIPIVEDGVALGLISQRDLGFLNLGVDTPKFTAKDFVNGDVISVQTGTPLVNVAYMMSDKKIGSVIVNNDQGEITGIFTSTDALNALVEVLRGDILSAD